VPLAVRELAANFTTEGAVKNNAFVRKPQVTGRVEN
jgi:hypothetical protein